MTLDSGTLPLRKDGQIDTRPLEVEEWLEGLPYVDFQRTGRLLHQALDATNKMPLKPGMRRELLELYHQPYEYYLNSRVRIGAQNTLQNLETMQRELRMMKQLAADLALASRRALDDSINRKSLWGQNKLPIDLLQRAMSYLSHALIFTFLEYAPTPRNVWKQLNSLYMIAEDLGQQRIQVRTPGTDTAPTTIEHTFSQIVLARVVDPYHLPSGSIWEIYEQLNDWVAKTRLQPFEPVNNPSGLFVVDLGNDTQPLPYSKFTADKAGPLHRLLDASELEPVIKRHLDRVQTSVPDENLKLSTGYAGNLLAHMLRAWTLPPKRYFPRKPKTGKVRIACGMNPVHYHMNYGRDYLREIGCASTRPVADGLDVSGDEHDDIMEATTSNYALDQWEMNNEGPGGYALVKNSNPAYPVRVGELIGINHPENIDKGNWSLGVIRWLMTDNRECYRLGIQLLARIAEPVAVRLMNGNHEDNYMRAFLIDKPGESVLVSASGLYMRNQDIEIVRASERLHLQVGKLLEADIGFEQFSLNL